MSVSQGRGSEGVGRKVMSVVKGSRARRTRIALLGVVDPECRAPRQLPPYVNHTNMDKRHAHKLHH
jgi:hypothetical protein